MNDSAKDFNFLLGIIFPKSSLLVAGMTQNSQFNLIYISVEEKIYELNHSFFLKPFSHHFESIDQIGSKY